MVAAKRLAGVMDSGGGNLSGGRDYTVFADKVSQGILRLHVNFSDAAGPVEVFTVNIPYGKRPRKAQGRATVTVSAVFEAGVKA